MTQSLSREAPSSISLLARPNSQLMVKLGESSTLVPVRWRLGTDLGIFPLLGTLHGGATRHRDRRLLRGARR